MAKPFHSNRMERRGHDALCAGARTFALEPHSARPALRAWAPMRTIRSALLHLHFMQLVPWVALGQIQIMWLRRWKPFYRERINRAAGFAARVFFSSFNHVRSASSCPLVRSRPSQAGAATNWCGFIGSAVQPGLQFSLIWSCARRFRSYCIHRQAVCVHIAGLVVFFTHGINT